MKMKIDKTNKIYRLNFVSARYRFFVHLRWYYRSTTNALQFCLWVRAASAVVPYPNAEEILQVHTVLVVNANEMRWKCDEWRLKN